MKYYYYGIEICVIEGLYALTREDSKYFGQDNGVPFPVDYIVDIDYCIQGGPGGQYRRIDVHLFIKTSYGKLLQIS